MNIRQNTVKRRLSIDVKNKNKKLLVLFLKPGPNWSNMSPKISKTNAWWNLGTSLATLFGHITLVWNVGWSWMQVKSNFFYRLLCEIFDLFDHSNDLVVITCSRISLQLIILIVHPPQRLCHSASDYRFQLNVWRNIRWNVRFVWPPTHNMETTMQKFQHMLGEMFDQFDWGFEQGVLFGLHQY